MEIHQFVPDFSYGDAIGNDAIGIQRILKGWGVESKIFSKVIHPMYWNRAEFYLYYRYHHNPDNILIFHYSTGTELIDFVREFPERKILIYHNITPAQYFEKVNLKVARRCREGREKLAGLTEMFDLALGDSTFNTEELKAMGFPNTGVLPIIVDVSLYEKSLKKIPRFPYLKRLVPTLLHVGRIAPNKHIEDIIKVFYFCKKSLPNLRLLLVGSHFDTETYVKSLEDLITRLNLRDVYLTGHLSTTTLTQIYAHASAYLCMSEHEGFCVPLVEAMSFDLPIVAYGAAAVPETLADAGILFDKKDYPAIAEAVVACVTNPELRDDLVQRGRKRLKAFTDEAVAPILKGHLERMGIEIKVRG